MSNHMVIGLVVGYFVACLLGILRSALRKDRFAKDMTAIIDGHGTETTSL